MERIGEQKREDVVAEKDSEMERVVKSTAEKDSEMEKAVRMMKMETKRTAEKETEKGRRARRKARQRKRQRWRWSWRAEQKIILLSNNGRPKERTQDNLRTTSPVQVPQKK